MRYLRLDEAARTLGIDADELVLFERESLITVKHTLDDEAVISAEDLERARLVLLLRELDVNLPGAEVIVHMRDEMIAMRRQFGEILEALVRELRDTLERPRGGDEDG